MPRIPLDEQILIGILSVNTVNKLTGIHYSVINRWHKSRKIDCGSFIPLGENEIKFNAFKLYEFLKENKLNIPPKIIEAARNRVDLEIDYKALIDRIT